MNLDYNPVLLLGIIVVELLLLYINWLARFRYKSYFKEGSSIWRVFDKQGKTITSLVLHFIFVMTFSISMYFATSPFLLFLCGFMLCNLIIDYMTLNRRLKCILLQCPELEDIQRCLFCEKTEKYIVSGFLNFRLKKRGKHLYEIIAEWREKLRKHL